MDIPDGQEFVLSGRKPLLARGGQTLRAMPVPTRVERNDARPAADPAIKMPAQRRRAAARDGAEHAQMLPGQPCPVFLDEARPVLADDVGHLEGWLGHRFCFRRDRRTVSGLDTAMESNGLAPACR